MLLKNVCATPAKFAGSDNVTVYPAVPVNVVNNPDCGVLNVVAVDVDVDVEVLVVVDVVEQWLGHWTGYVEETVFDVNMLIIDPKNVMVFGYNKQVFDALERYGITPHIVPFRHRYFWDGGHHCNTVDIVREDNNTDYITVDNNKTTTVIQTSINSR